MKRTIYTLILSAVIYLSSCTKDALAPVAVQIASNNNPAVPSTTSLTAATDTIVNTNGYLKLKLAKDTFNNDEVVICFKPKAKVCYIPGEDAPYLQGFGSESLCSLSSDNIPLAMNLLPLTQRGDTIALKVGANSDGVYKLSLTAINAVPEKFHVWLMDKYRKDSIDLRQNKTYLFDIYTADTSSVGKNRFKLVVR